VRQKDSELELLVVEDVDCQDVFLRSSCARTNVFKELTLKGGKITLGTAKIPDIDAISLLKMSMDSIPSKTVPSETIGTMYAKTCIKPEYFFLMWFQFSGDTYANEISAITVDLVLAQAPCVRTKDVGR